MSTSRYISEVTQKQVRQRPKLLCEYCHASEQWQYAPFTVDHVIPLAKGGANSTVSAPVRSSRETRPHDWLRRRLRLLR